jgi:hypothetical protein
VLGKRAFDMFTREIGDTTILNGMIALVCRCNSPFRTTSKRPMADDDKEVPVHPRSCHP